MLILSGRPSPYIIAFLLGESLLMVVGAGLAVYFRLGTASEILTFRYSWYRLLLVPVVLQVAFYYSDLHNFRISRPFIWTVARVTQAMAVGTLGLAVIYYFLPRLLLGRGILFLSFFITTLLVLIWRGLYSWALRQRFLASRVLIVGSGSLADSIIEELLSRSDNLYNVVGLMDLSGSGRRAGDDPTQDVDLMPQWASLLRAELRRESSELVGLIGYLEVDLVVVAMDEKRGRMPMDELLECRLLGVPIITGEDFYENIAGRILAERIRPGWMVFSPGFTTSRMRRFTKRSMDLALSGVGLVLTAPFTALVALAIKLESKGPVIYSQQRVGQNGQLFHAHKFRSMVTDAEQQTGPVWAEENDPRVTKVGRFIRKVRLDEIPQMYNVIKGEMSFVGPRPERPHFVEQLTAELPFYNERHKVKPGITGWAQVCYPYGSTVAAALEKLNYDLYYIKHTSLSLDLLIILQTIKIILFGGGGR
ncbi:MAG: TIGR03013 family PEP-CTERM/XrtA system glycosyltransferase [Desulfarculaceae bacterium]|nr:TIGR03013 family PEP-CTERM/XrtA system glycosyltransferase [Desulfarculaceae bacterium]MCF8074017.1 TIGR03013 family PEP-CTERM/XrtA system glycosyltransferase [Desulfarculaceae bacterium]MCF8102703.1 TIGR03013 family PEP-CTERM/XrtA system glycosyltransferase [Desulfarculaceae bacterium]MCF8116056.1 TIGR03013 family PEP-CTERM/XrtA system glycosyltransferase [Desulfarculaceae bacterium]